MSAQLAADFADHAALYESFADKLRKGEVIDAEASMLTINQTELYKAICRTGIDLAGDYAAFTNAPDELEGLDLRPLDSGFPKTEFGFRADAVAQHLAETCSSCHEAFRRAVDN